METYSIISAGQEIGQAYVDDKGASIAFAEPGRESVYLANVYGKSRQTLKQRVLEIVGQLGYAAAHLELVP